MSLNFRKHLRLWFNTVAPGQNIQVYLLKKCLVKLDLRAFRTVKNKKSFDVLEIRKCYNVDAYIFITKDSGSSRQMSKILNIFATFLQSFEKA